MKRFTILIVWLVLFSNWIFAQPAPIPSHNVPYVLNSGTYSGTGALAYREAVSVKDAAWLQLVFSRAALGSKSHIIIRSRLDGAWQMLNARTLIEWNNRSAYFNGSEVELELYAAAGDEKVSIGIREVIVGDYIDPTGRTSICGPTDDRVASSDPRVGRIFPVGCTGWIALNGKHLSAGHCFNGVTESQTLEFNVPPSLANGEVQHPPPQHQYAVNSVIYTSGGIGNDWAVFQVFNNSVTGLQPIQAQGAAFTVVSDLSPVLIRVTGYGVDDGADNQTQQTHQGDNAGSTGTTLRYSLDTQGGNSGSPVIDVATGRSLGIHTNGGCDVGGGWNSGTSFANAALWNAFTSTNMITNGNFELGIASWVASGCAVPNLIAGCNSANTAKVSITGKNCNAQFFQHGFAIERGKRYRVKFQAWSSRGEDMQLTVLPHNASTPNIGLDRRVDLGVTPCTNHQFDFVATGSSNDARLRFYFNYMSTTGYWYAFDNVSIERLLPKEGETEEIAIPTAFSLDQNFPNPFNPTTNISFSIPNDGNVSLKVFDLLGREVASLVNEVRVAGSYTESFDASALSSGTYFYRLESGNFVQTKKMLILR